MKLEHNYLNSMKQDASELLKDILEVENTLTALENLSSLEEYLTSGLASCDESTLEDIYETRGWEETRYPSYEEGEISLEELHELLLNDIKEDLTRYYTDNAKWDDIKNCYISLDELNSECNEIQESINESQKVFTEILDIINLIPKESITGIDTSYKSISTYVTCKTSSYKKIVEELESYINTDLIADSLGSEYEYDQKNFTIRISDHETGSCFDHNTGDYRYYSDGEISIII